MAALFNVGSFSKPQTPILLAGSFTGLGFSILILTGANFLTGLILVALALILSFFRKEQIKDLGIASLAIGLFYLSLVFFSQYLANSQLNIHSFQIDERIVFPVVILSTFFFRTPVPFLVLLAIFHQFIGFNILWFPALCLAHSLVSLAEFYLNVFRGHSRLKPVLLTSLVLQLAQFVVSFLFVYLFHDSLTSFFEVSTFLGSFQTCVIVYVVYQGFSILLLAPIIFLSTLLPSFNEIGEKKGGSQKIIISEGRGQCFSIHLSLLLLRQEFKKYTTAVHTLVKISRESDYGEDAINQRFARYQGMLSRVGEELKELCFNIGRQRSYRWHVKEIMSYYKFVNQLELLIEDLSFVASLLRKQDQDEEWERECRYWLGLQLKLFESFFHQTLGVGSEPEEKVQANIDKSYEVLDRFFVNKLEKEMNKNISQTFYRITESIGHLAL